MKKILYFMLMLKTFTVAQAQNTHYGTSAGLQGAAHSYFGYFAGNAALNTSYENSFFGSSSGRQQRDLAIPLSVLILCAITPPVTGTLL